MRVIAPVLGPVVTADLRVLIAGLTLLAYFKLTGFDVQWRAHWKHYLAVGTIGSAIPFVLYAYAALHIPASFSVIMNATAPLFGAVFAAFWLGETLTLRKLIGLCFGIVGVSLVAQVGLSTTSIDSAFLSALLACALAACGYGLVGVYIKRVAKGVRPRAMAGASLLMAGFVLLPFVPAFPQRAPMTPVVAANLLALALLCSAIAFLIYYKLLENVGPTKALTVTFLMPAFGMLWGVLFLGETVTPTMILGCALIVLGTALVLIRPRA